MTGQGRCRLCPAAILAVVLASVASTALGAQAPSGPRPVRLAIAGLVHGHVRGFLRALKGRTDVQLVGIAEPDAALRRAVLAEHGLAPELGFESIDDLLARARPEAVAAFTTTADHAAVVKSAAARRVHVMMEKPLAVGNADARTISNAADESGIHVIVNYETTWYPSLAEAYRVMTVDRAGGELRKLVAMDGHQGPTEIGVGPEFLRWLTDPAQNGAGALFDFGCYGANIMTWLMDGERPRSVRALTQQIKPQIYPRVDDEATILLEYPRAQAIIQASWNWPFNRKDVEVYGERAYAIATGGDSLRVRLPDAKEASRTPAPLPADERDSISYLAAVVRGRIKPEGRSSLANNVIVTEILDAARESARTGRAVLLPQR
jgi:predicted dehydrogenase